MHREGGLPKEECVCGWGSCQVPPIHVYATESHSWAVIWVSFVSRKLVSTGGGLVSRLRATRLLPVVGLCMALSGH